MDSCGAGVPPGLLHQGAALPGLPLPLDSVLGGAEVGHQAVVLTGEGRACGATAAKQHLVVSASGLAAEEVRGPSQMGMESSSPD